MVSANRWRAVTAVAVSAGLLAAGGATAHAATFGGPTSNGPAGTPDLHALAARANVSYRDGIRVYDACGAKAASQGILCYDPGALQTAYGETSLLAGGITGTGQTIVLPEVAFPKSVLRQLPKNEGIYLRQSLEVFDKAFKLPKVKLSFGTSLAGGSPTNRIPSQEEILDVEMAHAMAPGARIVVDPISGNLTKRLPALTRLAMKQGKLLSISFGIGESCLKKQLPAIQKALTDAAAKGVSAFASTGDDLDMSRTCNGNASGKLGLTLPGSDPLVTSVGGTQLTVAPTTAAYAGETVWNQQAGNPKAKAAGTGGGFSSLFPIPAYQAGVPGITTLRGVPDVAFSASETDGVETVTYENSSFCAKLARLTTGTSKGGNRCVIVEGVGGTSVGSPAWAGIGALADQYAKHPLGLLNTAIYNIGKSASYATAFHDVTTGDNTAIFKGVTIPGYSAGPGWDATTGWGSPNVAGLVPLLAAGG